MIEGIKGFGLAAVDPYLQSYRNAHEAFSGIFKKHVAEGTEETPKPSLSLKGRVAHLAVAVILLLPIFNYAILAGLKHAESSFVFKRVTEDLNEQGFVNLGGEEEVRRDDVLVEEEVRRDDVLVEEEVRRDDVLVEEELPPAVELTPEELAAVEGVRERIGRGEVGNRVLAEEGVAPITIVPSAPPRRNRPVEGIVKEGLATVQASATRALSDVFTALQEGLTALPERHM